MDWDAICEGAPGSMWAALARAPERWRGSSGGARRATATGAIMMVRANMMGLPADYCSSDAAADKEELLADEDEDDLNLNLNRYRYV